MYLSLGIGVGITESFLIENLLENLEFWQSGVTYA